MGENTLYKMYSKYILHTKKVSDVLILELAKSWWIFAAMPRATLSTTTYTIIRPVCFLDQLKMAWELYSSWKKSELKISDKSNPKFIGYFNYQCNKCPYYKLSLRKLYLIYNRALNFLYYLFSSFPLNLEWLQIRNSHHYYKSNRQKKLEVFCLATFYREIGMVEQCIYLLTYY